MTLNRLYLYQNSLIKQTRGIDNDDSAVGQQAQQKLPESDKILSDSVVSNESASMEDSVEDEQSDTAIEVNLEPKKELELDSLDKEVTLEDGVGTPFPDQATPFPISNSPPPENSEENFSGR